jgi:hypothetical protein
MNLDTKELMTPVMNHPLVLEVPEEIAKTSITTYQVVDEIKKLNLITPEESKRLADSQAFILSNFRDVPSYRPMIVKLTSVLSDMNFPTIDKKYWQCKIEAEVHFNELVRDYFKYERSIVDIEELAYKISEIESMFTKVVEPNVKLDINLITFDKKRLVLKKAQYEYELKILEKDIKFRIQEVIDWAFISQQLSGKCEYSTQSYQDHTIKGHVLYIKNMINNPKLTDADKKVFQDQLDTFNRLNKFS